MPRGKIYKDAYAVCGQCEREAVGLGAQPRADLKSRGWQLTRAKGWICGICVKENYDG